MMPENYNLHDNALWYIQNNFSVFPCNQKDKTPATAHGFKDASKVPALTEQRWRKNPEYNIGIATGSMSGGIVVIDLDRDPETGKDGYAELKKWERDNNITLPDTVQSITGRGGYHIFYRSSQSIPCSSNQDKGIDIRGDGGYIIAPPSIHPNGHRYEWEIAPDDRPIAEATPEVMMFINWAKQHDEADDAPEDSKISIIDEVTEKRVLTALDKIPVKDLSYDEWIHIGMAIHNIGMAFEIWDEWSKDDPRYNDGNSTTIEKWRSFSGTKSRWNAGTIFNIEKRFHEVAKEHRSTPIISSLASELQSADDVEEKTAEWLIPNFIPRYQITTLAGDGGQGKTTIECALASAITTGTNCFMTEHSLPNSFTSKPENVLFLSAEDDFSRVLKRKLRISGADMSRVFTLPISSPSFSKIKFASEELKELIAYCRPALVIFDPIQAFVPPDIQMGWRNAMRQCLNPLIGYGEQYGASFLIICHTNKQAGSYGRRRIAESADIWDISRSVLMVGDTGENDIKYMSHEKCNYGALQRTILYKLDGERIIYQGQSNLQDADYVRRDKASRSSPAKDEAKQIVIDTLQANKGSMKSADLDAVLDGQGMSRSTRNRAKAELKDEKIIRYVKDDFNGDWITALVKFEHE